MFDVKAYRTERNLDARDIVAIVQPQYPGYDKRLHSKVEHPDKYGVTLCDDAVDMVKAAYPETPQNAPQPPKQRRQYQLRCRITKAKRERLRQAFKRNGYSTLQDGLVYLIDKYLSEVSTC